jgi:hypothetical protein
MKPASDEDTSVGMDGIASPEKHLLVKTCGKISQ